jgi:threonine dehydrogenase-like Zn-dependent dehydrogenase
VLRISGKLDLAGVAPLRCAGITTYSPLRHWKVGPGQRAGIVGLGGLGHMGVKFAHAFGAHTVLFTTSPSKVMDAKRLGADEVVISKNRDEMAAHANSFDFILDTVGEVARLETGRFGAGLGYPADNFMSRKARVHRVMPFVACLVKVGMANAAIEDFNLDILRSEVAALE